MSLAEEVAGVLAASAPLGMPGVMELPPTPPPGLAPEPRTHTPHPTPAGGVPCTCHPPNREVWAGADGRPPRHLVTVAALGQPIAATAAAIAAVSVALGLLAK